MLGVKIRLWLYSKPWARKILKLLVGWNPNESYIEDVRLRPWEYASERWKRKHGYWIDWESEEGRRITQEVIKQNHKWLRENGLEHWIKEKSKDDA